MHGPGGKTVFTLGHSNHSPEHFLALLGQHGVTAVADVRSRPYTRYAKHFCREPLERLLRAEGVAYVFLGDLVGGKPDDPDLLGPDGQADYGRIAATQAFARGIGRIVSGAAVHVIALVCGEEDPSRCHRRHLNAPALAARGLDVRHIRGDSRVEREDDLRRAAQACAAPQQLLLL